MTKSLYISYNGIKEPIVRSQVLPYLRELTKQGIKFHLLTFEKEKICKADKIAIRKILKDDNIGWSSLRYHKKPTVSATILDVLVGIVCSLFIVIRHRIKVIHARAIVSALIGYPVSRLLFKKFIFDTRGVDSEEYVDAGTWEKGSLKHKVVGSLEDGLVRHADCVVVLTDKFLEILKNKHQKDDINFAVVPCAVDTNRFRKREPNDMVLEKLGLKDKFVISYIGSLGTWYMLSEMVDFFKVLKETVENAHFLILTQTDKEPVKKMFEEKGISPNDFTLGVAEHEKISDYLSVCKVGIFFIKPVFSKLSSSPVKFGEYLSSGLPVIINYGIGDTEEVTENEKVGVVIDSFDLTSYAKAKDELLNLLSDKSLSDRCRGVAEKHLSLKNAVNEYVEIYRSLTKV